MTSVLKTPVEYAFSLDAERIPLEPWYGRELRLEFTGEIACVHCGRKTNKSFDEGYCFPCSQTLAQCDMCIVRPEQCHFAAGTCREPEWGQAHCMRPHYVYLANSSGIKVGITRETQIPTRWIDQGAIQALPIFKVQSRLHSGLLEVVLKQHVADKTDWRKMLKGLVERIDLPARRDELLARCAPELEALTARLGAGALQPLPDAEAVDLEYRVIEHPTKVTSLSLDKTPEIRGTLLGIKGQYLILDSGVLNVRKFSGYDVVVHS